MNLADTILRIINNAEINKKIKKNVVNNINAFAVNA